MNPVILHEDGTECHHEGAAKAALANGTAMCAAGLVVTHVRIDDNVITLEEAGIAFTKMVEVICNSMQPFISAVSNFVNQLDKVASSNRSYLERKS